MATGIRTSLDRIPGRAVALDRSGRILASNAEFDDCWRMQGRVVPPAGADYVRDCCDSPTVAEGVAAVLGGRADAFFADYRCTAGPAERWFTVRVRPLDGGVLVTHLDVTEARSAEGDVITDPAAQVNPELGIYAELGPDLSILHVSGGAARLLGFDPTGTATDDLRPFLEPADADELFALFARVTAVPGAADAMRIRVRDVGGVWREVEVVVANRLHDPEVRAITVAGADVTEARRARITRSLTDHLFQQLPVAVVVTDDRGVVLYWNERATEMFGFAAADVLGRHTDDLGLGPRAGAPLAEITASIGASGGRWEGDYEAVRDDGTVVPVYMSLQRIDDDEIGFHGVLGTSIELTERRRLEADLEFRARHDPLTGLPNRRHFVEHLERALARTQVGRGVGILFVDIDDFKEINDTRGHAAGDAALVRAGELLRHAVRDGDVVGRFGGDEFVICCGDLADIGEAAGTASRVLAAVADTGTGLVSASVGVAFGGPGVHAEALLRDADMAMYEAKENGKACVALFDEDVRSAARLRLAATAALGRAIDDGELEPHFQPIVDLRSGTLLGFEALARWQHPTRGLVEPADFVPLAEDSGLVTALGRVMLTAACGELARWRAATDDDLTVAVNVAAAQLLDERFPALVRRAIEGAGVPADRVCLEVTEHSLMDAEAADRALRELKAVGVRLAIDDFGTGYSSLARLRSFPVDLVKIDRSFADGLGRDPDDESIVRAIVDLSRTLGLRVVIEGIEDEAQADVAARLGCGAGQGYHWSRAVPAEDALHLVTGTVPLPAAPAPTGHTAVLHRDDDELLDALGSYVLDGLRSGAGALVIATPEHRDALAGHLSSSGIDLTDPALPYVALDAASTLETFLVDGAPDPGRFDAVARAALSTVGVGTRPIRAYGEMVGLLWDDRRVLAALQLEGLWNRLRADVPFALLCGYRADDDTAPALERACHLHHHHVTPLAS